MESIQVDNKRITKNAAVLYLRMAVTMFVSFYTSRVILQVLGVVDFGIYNVVYGVTMVVTFFSGSLMNVTQRYLNLGIGSNDLQKTNNYFNQFVAIFCGLSLIVFLLGEAMSVWVVDDLLAIPKDRITASHWVYQFSLFALVLTLIQIPFQAAVIANERMGAFAYLTLFESFAKLGILFLIQALSGDNLILYTILLFIISAITFVSYIIYCYRFFPECKIRYFFERKLAREMSSFVGYNVYGCFAFSMSQQGVNVLLNIFFGPAINAARAIAMQVYQGIYKFSDNLLVAVRPPIIKLYAQNDIEQMIILSANTTRYCLFLNTLLVMPVIFNVDYILRIWLGMIPAYTSAFVCIILVESYFNIMNQMITVLVNATGNLKRNQFYGRTYTLLVLPISYVLLLITENPVIPIVLTVVGSVAYFFNNLYDAHLQLGVNMNNYCMNTILPVCILHAPLILLFFIITKHIEIEWIKLVVTMSLDLLLGSVLIFAFFLNRNEKQYVLDKLSSKASRIFVCWRK